MCSSNLGYPPSGQAGPCLVIDRVAGKLKRCHSIRIGNGLSTFLEQLSSWRNSDDPSDDINASSADVVVHVSSFPDVVDVLG